MTSQTATIAGTLLDRERSLNVEQLVRLSTTPYPAVIPLTATGVRLETVSRGAARTRMAEPPPSTPTGPRGITDQTSRLPFPRLIAAYACLAGIYFVSTLDINAVALALPVIGQDLGVGSTITWTGTAYLMGQVAFQALYGRFSDIFGRKPVLLVCVGFLVLGDVLCGLARTASWLYACRALSGIGGGGISSLISIIVSDLVSLKDRGRYQGILGSAIGLGATAGPFLAAAFLQSPRQAGVGSWRWIFFIPPILSAACAIASIAFLPLKVVDRSWQEKIRQVDWMGLGAALVGMMCVLVPINLGGSVWPWASAPVLSMLVVGGAAVVAFGIIETRFAAIPIIPFHIFSHRATAILIVQSALYNLVWQVDIYFLPAYFHSIRGYSTIQTAVLMLPLLLMQSVVGIASGPLMSKFRGYGYILHPGMCMWFLGTALKIAYSQDTSLAFYVVSMFIIGGGIGFVFQPALVALQALCSPQDRAIATSTRNLFRMFGSVVGMTMAAALQAAVMQKALPPNLPAAFDNNGSIVQKSASTEGDMWSAAVASAKMQGFRAVFAMEIPMMALCCVASFWIPNVRLSGDVGDEHEMQRVSSS